MRGLAVRQNAIVLAGRFGGRDSGSSQPADSHGQLGVFL